MRIIGLSLGHGAAAVYLQDGQIRTAVEEEKLTREKGVNTFPKKAMGYILKTYQLKPQDIDRVAVGCEQVGAFVYNWRTLNDYFDRRNLRDRVEGYFYDGLKRLFPHAINLSQGLKKHFFTCMKDLGFESKQIHFVNHHLAHAASAYYTCPWKETLILTSDGKGDGLCSGLYTGLNGAIRCVDQVQDLDSLGQFYGIVTKFLGFKINRHEGKITGLAAFGDSSQTFKLMNDIFQLESGKLHNRLHDQEDFKRDPIDYFIKQVHPKDFLHVNYLKSLHGSRMYYAVAYQLYLNYFKKHMSSIEAKDVAAGVQKLTEEALVTYLKEKLKVYPHKNICLAGGVFANVKVNQRIREIPGVENVYIQPAMDDAGTSLGAALMVWFNEQPKKQWPSLESVYLGPDYSEKDMEDALKKYNLSYRRLSNPEEEIGKMIAEGKIVGRFNGALEWGPRALGNRSIIANPCDKTINDSLNQRLKRTEFMPFAPSMIDEDAPLFLQNYNGRDVAVKYMTTTYHTNPALQKKIEASVHVDGTARPQVVTEKENPSFYKIIKAYKKHSGFGVVINTSFNMHEEPIVNSPDDAIRAFLVNAVDVLSLGPFLVQRHTNKKNA